MRLIYILVIAFLAGVYSVKFRYHSKHSPGRSNLSTRQWINPNRWRSHFTTPQWGYTKRHMDYTTRSRLYNICYEYRYETTKAYVTEKIPCTSTNTKSSYPVKIKLSDSDKQSSRLCARRRLVYVKVLKKHRTCCRGWTLGKNGTCDVRSSTACAMNCLNGGTCNSASRRCQCSRNFTGSFCEIPNCRKPCLNGGRCSIDHTCKCPHNFVGIQCEKAICSRKCLNHGRCVMNGLFPSCQCRYPYYGTYCEKRKSLSERYCYYSKHYYKIGQSFSPHRCIKCVCLSPRPGFSYGGASCSRIPCSPCLSYYKKYTSQSCCSYCSGSSQKPFGYRVPTFDNCPAVNEIVVVDLKAHENHITIQSLWARDYTKRLLKVVYSSTRFTYRQSHTHDNIHRVSAVASDIWGSSVYCHYYIRVRDPFPPYFINCPSDQFLSNSRSVLPVAQARDNIGLIKQPHCDRRSISDRDGYHLVTCVATDHDGNSAYCQYAVNKFRTEHERRQAERRLYPESHTSRHHHHGHHHHGKGHHHHHKIPVIIGGIVGFLILLLLAVGILFYCKHRRHRHHHGDHHHHDHGHHHHHGGHHHGGHHHGGHHHGHHHHHHGHDPDYDCDEKKTADPPGYESIITGKGKENCNEYSKPIDISDE